MNDEKEKVLKWIECNAPKHLPLFKRVYFGRISRKDADKAKCLDCCGFIVEEVKHCEATTCALWRLRPYQAKGVGPTINKES